MDNCPSVSLRFSRINVSRSRRIYTIAPCYWVVKVTRHVHRKLQPDITVCSRKHQRAKSRSGWPSRRTGVGVILLLTGLNTPRIAARSPSRLPKKEHRIASGLGNHASERCCAQPLALPLAQSYIKYTDVTRASCSSFPWAHDLSTHTDFMCLRDPSDGANPFIAATAIQLTPKLYYI